MELQLNQKVIVNAPDRGLVDALAYVVELQRYYDGELHTVIVETSFLRYRVCSPEQVKAVIPIEFAYARKASV